MRHHLTLKFKLDPADADQDDIVERLGAAGCTNALVGIGTAGYLSPAFSREAASAAQAIRQAVAEVQAVVSTAQLVEVRPE